MDTMNTYEVGDKVFIVDAENHVGEYRSNVEYIIKDVDTDDNTYVIYGDDDDWWYFSDDMLIPVPELPIDKWTF